MNTTYDTSAATGCLDYRQVCRRKSTAAILLAASVAIPYILTSIPWVDQFFLEYFYSKGYLGGGMAHVISVSVIDLFPNLLMLTGYLLLIRCAANRPCKTAIMILAAITLLYTIGNAIMTVTGVAMMPDKVSGFLSVMSVVAFAIHLIAIIGYMYSIPLIIRNCMTSENEKSWITMLAVFNSLTWSLEIINIFGFCWTGNPEDSFYASTIYSILLLIMTILRTIAYVKLAMSGTFSEKHYEPAARPYSPLNRYVAGILIATAVSVTAVWVYYSFAASHINNLF